jgi:hypothetical protein
VADSVSGLQILDISDPSSITSLGVYNPAGYVFNVKISADGSKAFLAAEKDGLRIVDISDASNPVSLGRYDTTSNALDISISADETKAYVIDLAALWVIDITDSTAPTLLSSYALSDYVGLTLSRDGRTAYVAGDFDGYSIFDVSRDYVVKSTDFGSSSINLRIASDNNVALTMSVTADRSDIITLGTYPTSLAYADYNGSDIEIPISSISSATGVTAFTVTLSNGLITVTRTIYVDVI